MEKCTKRIDAARIVAIRDTRKVKGFKVLIIMIKRLSI